MNDLPRLVIMNSEGGAECFVTAHDFRKRRPERGDIELTSEAHRERNVIGGRARVELMNKPEPLLCVGKRQRFGSGDALWPRGLKRVAGAELRIDILREFCDRRRFKQRVERYFN